MRSTVILVALVGFALLNTVFLGAHLLSSGGGAATTSGTGSLTLGLQSTLGSSQTASLSGAQQTVIPSNGTSVTITQSATSTVTNASTAEAALGNSVSSSSASVTLNSTSTSTSTSTESSATTTPNGIAGVAPTTSESSSGNTSAVNFAATSRGTGAYQSWSALVLAFFEDHSLILAPSSWFAVGGMWIWRGRMRAKWTGLGFDSDVFTLFVKMKGAKTRIRLLDALDTPKDRLQLAEELGLDWKSVDRHVAVMKKYGFVDDKLAYGRVRLYQLTPNGVALLNLLQELSKEEKGAGVEAAPL